MTPNSSVLTTQDVDKIIQVMEERMQHLLEERVMHRKDAASFLGITERTLDRLSNKGKVPYHRLDGLAPKLYLKSELIHLIKTS